MHHISHTAIWISNFFLGEGGSAERGRTVLPRPVFRGGRVTGAVPPPQTPPPLGRGILPPQTPSHRRLRRLHSSAFGTRLPRPHFWIRAWFCEIFSPPPPAKIPACAHAHLTLILLLHYLVKCRSRSLAVYNNEFIYTGSACVGSENNCETKKSLKKRPSLCPHSH